LCRVRWRELLTDSVSDNRSLAALVISVIAEFFSSGFDWAAVVSLSVVIGAIATTAGAAIALLLTFLFRAWGPDSITDVVCSLIGLAAVWTGIYALIFVGQRGWSRLLVVGLPSILGAVIFTNHDRGKSLQTSLISLRSIARINAGIRRAFGLPSTVRS
jgi:hypothetical protein